jgi:uncharacterized protein involved in exopolysaccharide biosynthesis
MIRIRIPAVLSSISLSLAVASGAAQAAGSAPPPHEGTREELRACLSKKDDIDARTKELVPKQAEMQKDLSAVAAQQKAITAEQAKLNKRDAKAVTAFNTKLADLDREIDDANGKADAYNAEQQSLHTQEVDWYTHCSTATYKSWDEEAVMKERQTAAPAK